MLSNDLDTAEESSTYRHQDIKVKTMAQLQALKKILLEELKRLPENNFFGDSNAPDRERLHGWIIDLIYIEEFGVPADWHSDVGFWFTGESWSPLTDYGQSHDDFAEHERLLRYAAWLNM